MKHPLLVFSLAVLASLTLTLSSSAAPDPVNCTGYPEPRIYLENQSWWEPQLLNPGDPLHPGTGKQGHIHVGGCFPLYQNLTADTLHLDLRLQLHNMTGNAGFLQANLYGDVSRDVRPRTIWNGGQPDNVGWHCTSADCDRWIDLDMNLAAANYRGLHEFNIQLFVYNHDATKHQYNITRWHATIDRPLPEAPNPSILRTTQQNAWIGVGGDTWYSLPGGKYARAGMVREDVPWNEQTGELTPVSGTWTPRINFEKQKNFVWIDPALHATPPSQGTVVWEQTTTNTGYHTQQLSINTTQLTDGIHRLVFGSASVQDEGNNTGVGVIPFLVENGC